MTLLTEEMFASGQPAAQGEVLIWMKKFAPQELLSNMAKLKMVTEMKSINGGFILGHSETGHHHVLECTRAKTKISNAALALIDAANDTFVELKLHESCRLRHLRKDDTHGELVFPAGEYVRALRDEQSPEGWRRVKD